MKKAVNSKKVTNLLKIIYSYISKNKKELLYSFFASIIFLGAFSKINYTTDTYADIMESYEGISGNFLGAGRFFAFLMYWLYKNGLGFEATYYLSFVLLIITISLSIYTLNKYLQSTYLKQEKVTSRLLATTIVINPFTIELFFYLEKGIMSSAILFSILGSILLLEFFKKRQKRNLILSFIFCFLSACSYQGIVGLYVILTSIFILLEKSSVKRIIKCILVCGAIYLASIILNLLLAKLVNGTTKSGMSSMNIIATAIAVLSGMIKMIKLYNILPATIVYLLIVAIYVSFIRNAKTQNIKEYNLKLASLILLIVGVSVLPYLSQSPNSVWFVPRSSWPYAAGIFCILSFTACQKKSTKKTLKQITTFCSLILIAEFLVFSQITISHYQTNALDKLTFEQLDEKIATFEQKNNSQITKAIMIRDNSINFIYPQVIPLGDVQVMAMATSWSDINALNYYSHRNLIKIEANDQAKESCIDENKMGLDITFLNADTIVICKH